MKKVTILFVFFASFVFSQNYISLSYEKPGSQNVKNEYGIFNKDVRMNGVSAAWQRSIINNEEFLLKAGCKFSYCFGSFFETSSFSSKHSFDSDINIYDFELNTSISYNAFPIKPFAGLGLGLENYRRTVKYADDVDTFTRLIPLNEYGFLITYFIGLSYQFLDFMSVTAQYSEYRFDYENDYGTPGTSWGWDLSNKRENVSIGLTYIF